jgi:hypothetical protein
MEDSMAHKGILDRAMDELVKVSEEQLKKTEEKKKE